MQALGELGKSQKLEEKSTASSSSFTEQTDQRDSSTPLPCAKTLNKMDHLSSNRIGNADEPSLGTYLNLYSHDTFYSSILKYCIITMIY